MTLTDHTRRRRHRQGRTALTLVLIAALSTTAVTACGGDDGDTSPTTEAVDLNAAPTDVHWSSITGGIKVPSADEGPSERLDHGAVAGFDHSPVGAGLAAMNQPTRAAVAPEGSWSEAAAEGIAFGPGRDLYLNSRVGVEATGKTNKEFIPTLDGWKITDYSDDVATVAVYASYSDGSMSATTYQMVWTADDWKVELPEDGQGSMKAVDNYPDDMVKVSSNG